MKRLLALLVGLLLIAVGIQQVIAGGSCTDCNWAPSSWTSVSVMIYPDSPNYAETQQSFVWSYENLEAFLALDAYYQYEIRRDRDVWGLHDTRGDWRNNCYRFLLDYTSKPY